MTAVRLHGVGKDFGRTAVLRNVDLAVADGEFIVFVGPSGCGKSTLLRLIAGLEEPTAGDIFIGPRRVNALPPAKRGVAMVFQSYALYPHMTVYGNMAFGLKLARNNKTEIDRRVRQAAQTLRIETLLDRLPKELSGGQRQRVAIGRAIVRQPEVFLFDEPLSNLDAALRVQMRVEIARLHGELNASMIYVTHDQIEAMTLADRIVLLNTGETVQTEGSVAQIGTPLELYHHPRNRFVAGFIGSPTMNFIPARLTRAGGGDATVTLAGGTAVCAAVDATGAQPQAAITLGIRPEHVTLGGDNAIFGRAQHVEQLGDVSFIHARVDGAETPLIVRQAGASRVQPGDLIVLGLPANQCHLFDERGCAYPRTTKAERL